MTSLINSGAKVLLFCKSAIVETSYFDELPDLKDERQISEDE